jgi:hypothetical protein
MIDSTEAVDLGKSYFIVRMGYFEVIVITRNLDSSRLHRRQIYFLDSMVDLMAGQICLGSLDFRILGFTVKRLEKS